MTRELSLPFPRADLLQELGWAVSCHFMRKRTLPWAQVDQDHYHQELVRNRNPPHEFESLGGAQHCVVTSSALRSQPHSCQGRSRPSVSVTLSGKESEAWVKVLFSSTRTHAMTEFPSLAFQAQSQKWNAAHRKAEREKSLSAKQRRMTCMAKLFCLHPV